MRITTKLLSTLVMTGAVLAGSAALATGPATALPCADCEPGGGTGDGGGGGNPPPPVPALTAYERTDFGNSGLHMETWARVSRNVGLVTGEPTHTWNTWWGIGYHGSVSVLLLDANGDVIGVTNPQTYGVDAKAWVWNRSDRRDLWQQTFDPVVTQRTASVRILHTNTSRDNFLNIVREIRDRACVVWGVIQPGRACPLGPVAG